MSILSSTEAGKIAVFRNAIEKCTFSDSIIKSLEKETAIYRPNDKWKIMKITRSYIEVAGNECSLNWLDVSNILDFSGIFYNSKFNGDISKWDVSKAMNLSLMFKHSKFNGDISNWDVSNCADFSGMFAFSIFNGDISKWNMKSATDISEMFTGSEFDGYINDWNVSNVQYADHIFKDMKHQNIDISKWDLYEMSKWREMLSGKAANTNELLDSLMK